MSVAKQKPITEDDWTSDWSKAGTWDLWVSTRDGGVKFIDSIAEMTAYFQGNATLEGRKYTDAELRAEFVAFMKRPAAIPMPEKLRAEIGAYLESSHNG